MHVTCETHACWHASCTGWSLTYWPYEAWCTAPDATSLCQQDCVWLQAREQCAAHLRVRLAQAFEQAVRQASLGGCGILDQGRKLVVVAHLHTAAEHFMPADLQNPMHSSHATTV